MLKIFKYSFYDMIRNRWLFFYTGFFLIVTTALLFLSADPTKIIITLTNVILGITPLVGMLSGLMYFYNSREFAELLLTQPVSRNTVFTGIYLGIAASLTLSVCAGIIIPLLFYNIFSSDLLGEFLVLIGMAMTLSIIFSLIAFLIAIQFGEKIKGFGVAIFTWLFFALIYDGLFLILLMFFKAYPLEKLSIALTLLNPIGLARILIILKLDISAMMGYSGAVLEKFFGSGLGSAIIVLTLFAWIAIPAMGMLRISAKKDF